MDPGREISTPGPLIMVVQFVAFVGAYRYPGSLDPWLAAVVAALPTTWVSLVPCFVFVFVERSLELAGHLIAAPWSAHPGVKFRNGARSSSARHSP